MAVAPVVPWIANGEAAAAQGSLLDIVNRPLKYILTKIGLSDIVGFLGLVPTANVKAFGAIGDGVADDTVAVQAAIDYCSFTNTVYGTLPYVYLPWGKYKITSKLRVKNIRVRIQGSGMYHSMIHYHGVAAGCIVYDAVASANPNFSDFSIVGDAASGPGLDFSAPLDFTYNFTLERMQIFAGGKAIHGPQLFSGSMDTVYGESINEHIFVLRLGPSVSLRNSYAGRCGATKVGWRVAGCFHPVSCNGVNTGGYWMVAGSNPAGTDGFQNDFPGLTDYPDVHLMGCNVEAFAVTGLYFAQAYQNAKMTGGSINRDLPGTYHSIIRTVLGSLSAGGYVELDGVRFLTSGGAATGSLAWSDYRDQIVLWNDNTGITGIWSVADGVLYSAVKWSTTRNSYGQTFMNVTGIAADISRPKNVQAVSADVTYSAAMVQDSTLQDTARITPTNGTAYSFNATGGKKDQELTVQVVNTTGGALGVMTWGAAHKLSAWTQPATGFSRSITFKHNGTFFVEKSRTAVDVPN